MVTMGQAKHMGKWESHAAMVRLVREMQDRLEEAGLISSADKTAADNVVYAFLSQTPAKVRDELVHG